MANVWNGPMRPSAMNPKMKKMGKTMPMMPTPLPAGAKPLVQLPRLRKKKVPRA